MDSSMSNIKINYLHMKKILLMVAALGIMVTGCKQKTTRTNPFLVAWDTPYGIPPFEQIQNEDYMPAFEEGMKQHKAEIENIVNNTEAPSFENTIYAMDTSGRLLAKVGGVFFNLSESDGDSVKDQILAEMSVKLSQHQADITMNPKLFARVKAVYEDKANHAYTPAQIALIDKTYKNFERNGANLNEKDQAELRKINEELSVLSVKFEQNVLADHNAFELVIDNKNDLAGLPQSAIDAAAETAKAKGKEGKWIFTLDEPSRIPFLQYASNRSLREKMFKAYEHKGNNNNANDNKEIVSQMVSLRVRQAQLLGFDTYAAFVLDQNMSKTPETVFAFLNKVWGPTTVATKAEAVELQKMIDAEGSHFTLEPWDWWYYAEKLRKAKYDLDEEAIRPYLQLENVQQGAFMVANKLYGITFEKLKDVPTFNPEAQPFMVKDADGTELGILYMDFFPRPSKRTGAWMNNIRDSYVDKDGKRVLPIIVNICNFSKPTADKPSLLTTDEASTLFHEFGHALHGLLTQVPYSGIAGTAVYRDFVELPSQIMEHWSLHPQVLKMYAKHYKTGEIIPDSLVQKMENAKKFNQGFIATEFMAACFLDMDWYTVKTTEKQDVIAFEKAAMKKIGLIESIIPRYRTTYFRHAFTGGYSAGYYGYLWAELLDADAFHAFVEKGDIFDQATAKAFRTNILEKGGSEDPAKLYRDFRGKAPNESYLLLYRGLK